jgi:uncharacterized alkaline shock family protein YloU
MTDDTQSPQEQAPPVRDKAEVNATFQVDDATEVRGTVRIAPAVLIQLIETTVSEIPGVIELKPRRRRKNDDTPAPIGKSFDDGKVRVSVDGDQIEAEVSITVARGTNVATLADAIRREVGVAAGRMLGMTVRTVNIYIDDIVDPAA